MQQLTYVNVLGEKVDFYQAPYIFCRAEGLGPTTPEIATVAGAYQPGATVRNMLRGSRNLDLTLHIKGLSRQEMYRYRQQLSGVLAADKAFDGVNCAKLYYENDNGRWWTWAVPQEGPSDGKRFSHYLTSLTLSLLCESAYWFSTGQRTAAFLYSGEGFDFPFSFPVSFGSRDYAQEVTNGGQVAAPVEVVIEGCGETPSLLNETTGQRLKLTAALPAGAALYINTDPARLAATLTDGDGEHSAFGLLDVASPLSAFTLRPGVNRLVYEPGGAASLSNIKLAWYDRFEGV